MRLVLSLYPEEALFWLAVFECRPRLFLQATAIESYCTGVLTWVGVRECLHGFSRCLHGAYVGAHGYLHWCGPMSRAGRFQI